MRFTKMHGLGNDFIIINNLNNDIELTNNQILLLCSRKYGIGADGLILVNTSTLCDIKMTYYNADGNEVQMCGNGIRCFAKYVFDNEIINKKMVKIETLAGIKETEVILLGDEVQNVRVNMGNPIFQGNRIPININKNIIINEIIEYKDLNIVFDSMSMGNPHVIIQVDDLDNYPLQAIGKFIENHHLFPEKTNVNFCQIIDRDNIKIVTWERGVGLTLACGTGTCATVTMMHKKELVNKSVVAQLPGGLLTIEVEEVIYMTGEAVKVFDGIIDLVKI